jgi:hypothetical protein
MWWLRARRVVKALADVVARHDRHFTQLGIKLGEHTKAIAALEKTAPVNLAAEVTSLAEQVSRLRATHQRFQGRFDKYIALEHDDSQRDDDAVDDPKWNALMALQRQQHNGGG